LVLSEDLQLGDPAERLKRGLAARLELLVTVTAASDEGQETSAPINTIAHAIRPSNTDVTKISDADVMRRAVILSTALRIPSFTNQLRFLGQFSSPSSQQSRNLSGEIGLLVTYSAGLVSGFRPESLELFEGLADIDFAIVYESIVRFSASRLLSPDAALRARRACESFTQAAYIILSTLKRAANADPHNDPFTSTLILSGPLADFRSRIQVTRTVYLGVAGPDIFTSLQLLSDDQTSISRTTLGDIEALAGEWHLSGSFWSLLLLRILGPYQLEKRFFSENEASWTRVVIEKPLIDQISALLQKRAMSRLVKPKRKSYIGSLLYHYSRINTALINMSARAVIDGVIALYEFDLSLMGFLDWEEIYEVIKDHRFLDARTTFLTYLMGQPFVHARFPYVALATGKGALIADLNAAIKLPGRGSIMSKLLSDINSLPPAPAAALTAALLERSVIERLSTALPRPKFWPKDLPPADTARVSVVKIQALELARSRGLITSDFAELETKKEQDQLRIHYFQRRMKSGRVYVNSPAIENAILVVLDAEMPAMRALSTKLPENSAAILTALLSALAQKLSVELILEPGISIDQALSSNLRHGIVGNRFLRCFDDALQIVTESRGLFNWDQETLTRLLDEDGSSLLDLRDSVADTVKYFLDRFLTLRPSEPFCLLIGEQIEKSVSSALASARNVSHARLSKHIQGRINSQLARHLVTARRALVGDIRRTIAAGIQRCRAGLKHPGASPTTFLDSLETNLQEAYDEVAQWIGINSEIEADIPFKLSEIVDVQLVSTALSAANKLNVETECYVMREGKQVSTAFLINKIYLNAFQEVVHNLLTNAFKYSGKQLRTAVRLRLTVDKGFCVLTCINDFTAERLKIIIENYPQTRKYAGAPIGRQARLRTHKQDSRIG
jgi:hypothetical protein